MTIDYIENTMGHVPEQGNASVDETKSTKTTTLALIKPDAMDKKEDILEKIKQSGFTIIQEKQVQLSKQQVEEFYKEHEGKPFYHDLTTWMSSAPIYAMILEKENAVRAWRDLMGPTNANKAREEHPESIRALFGTDGSHNATHGSDSATSAAREIGLAFGLNTTEVQSLQEQVESTEICKHEDVIATHSTILEKPSEKEEEHIQMDKEDFIVTNGKDMTLDEEDKEENDAILVEADIPEIKMDAEVIVIADKVEQVEPTAVSDDHGVETIVQTEISEIKMDTKIVCVEVEDQEVVVPLANTVACELANTEDPEIKVNAAITAVEDDSSQSESILVQTDIPEIKMDTQAGRIDDKDVEDVITVTESNDNATVEVEIISCPVVENQFEQIAPAIVRKIEGDEEISIIVEDDNEDAKEPVEAEIISCPEIQDPIEEVTPVIETTLENEEGGIVQEEITTIVEENSKDVEVNTIDTEIISCPIAPVAIIDATPEFEVKVLDKEEAKLDEQDIIKTAVDDEDVKEALEVEIISCPAAQDPLVDLEPAIAVKVGEEVVEEITVAVGNNEGAKIGALETDIISCPAAQDFLIELEPVVAVQIDDSNEKEAVEEITITTQANEDVNAETPEVDFINCPVTHDPVVEAEPAVVTNVDKDDKEIEDITIAVEEKNTKAPEVEIVSYSPAHTPAVEVAIAIAVKVQEQKSTAAPPVKPKKIANLLAAFEKPQGPPPKVAEKPAKLTTEKLKVAEKPNEPVAEKIKEVEEEKIIAEVIAESPKEEVLEEKVEVFDETIAKETIVDVKAEEVIAEMKDEQEVSTEPKEEILVAEVTIHAEEVEPKENTIADGIIVDNVNNEAEITTSTDLLTATSTTSSTSEVPESTTTIDSINNKHNSTDNDDVVSEKDQDNDNLTIASADDKVPSGQSSTEKSTKSVPSSTNSKEESGEKKKKVLLKKKTTATSTGGVKSGVNKPKALASKPTTTVTAIKEVEKKKVPVIRKLVKKTTDDATATTKPTTIKKTVTDAKKSVDEPKVVSRHTIPRVAITTKKAATATTPVEEKPKKVSARSSLVSRLTAPTAASARRVTGTEPETAEKRSLVKKPLTKTSAPSRPAVTKAAQTVTKTTVTKTAIASTGGIKKDTTTVRRTSPTTTATKKTTTTTTTTTGTRMSTNNKVSSLKKPVSGEVKKVLKKKIVKKEEDVEARSASSSVSLSKEEEEVAAVAEEEHKEEQEVEVKTEDVVEEASVKEDIISEQEVVQVEIITEVDEHKEIHAAHHDTLNHVEHHDTLKPEIASLRNRFENPTGIIPNNSNSKEIRSKSPNNNNKISDMINRFTTN